MSSERPRLEFAAYQPEEPGEVHATFHGPFWYPPACWNSVIPGKYMSSMAYAIRRRMQRITWRQRDRERRVYGYQDLGGEG